MLDDLPYEKVKTDEQKPHVPNNLSHVRKLRTNPFKKP
jgi:hypothetical protein